VNYASQALKHLLLKPRLTHNLYHISAGEEASCTWNEIAAAFASTTVLAEENGDSVVSTQPGYRRVAVDVIESRRPEFDALFGTCNKNFMMKAIRLYGAFAGLDTVFETNRLRAEGFPASPRFSDYLEVCQQTSSSYSVAEQMLIDFA
jgi:hypothetical protein